MFGNLDVGRNLKQCDGLTWLTLTPYFTTDLHHCDGLLQLIKGHQGHGDVARAADPPASRSHAPTYSGLNVAAHSG